ncbi:MAG TPA: hypothetical protein VHV47_02205 [Opitutaceae bacterium]|nr:hypothetical protein [Opitutaceae bacterium]
MPTSPRPAPDRRGWRRPRIGICLAALIAAWVWLAWMDVHRAERIAYVSGQGSGEGPVWRPRLIVPGRDLVAYEWLDQTRQMFARREWRVRAVDYENAPKGHAVSAASPYRWWLGLLAWADRGISGGPIGEALERAALVADPLLLALALGGFAWIAVRHFGSAAAALGLAALAALFPLGGEFLPGAPEAEGLACLCALGSVLPILAGLALGQGVGPESALRSRRWFRLAGCVGGAGLWCNPAAEAPILVGVALGGVFAAWVGRSKTGEPAPAPWRDWGWTGAAFVVVAWLIERFPAHLGEWQLNAVNPAHALAWIGAAEALVRGCDWIQGHRRPWTYRRAAGWVLSLAAIAVVPVILWQHRSLMPAAVDPPALRLSRLPDSPAAVSLKAWLLADGPRGAATAALAPFVLVLAAFGCLVRRGAAPASRALVAAALGPVLAAVAVALVRLRWWNEADAVLVALVLAVTASLSSGSAPAVRWLWRAAVLGSIVPSLFLLAPPRPAGGRYALDDTDVYQLIERDLARWMDTHADPGGAVVLAPPDLSTSLYYYGGIRGLATLAWDNRDGLEAAMRIASALTPEEAKELIDRRGVTAIVIPSWDPYLDVYARMGMGQLEGTFMERLHNWRLPPWLRPEPYLLPSIPGFEGRSLLIFRVVEDQDEATAMSRIGEYFVDAGKLDQAEEVAAALRRFPASMGAWVARAQIALARGDRAGAESALRILLPRLNAAPVRNLPWDRRVALAILLTEEGHLPPARDLARRCVAEMNGSRIRSLSAGKLYRLLVLERAFGFPLPDPGLRPLALDLLPQNLRERL